MHHRIQAISHIQQCLADPTSALSDETVASVFQMLCIEENLILHAGDEAFTEYPAWKHMQPDSSQRKAHMAGLKRMLALRGGISELGNTRGLQAFLIRWVCTSLACRLVFALPDTKLYGPPTNKNELDSFMLDDTTFAASYLLPRGMLKKLYRYPETSPHYIPILSLDDPLATVECAMAWGCAKTKMNPELIRHIITIDCLLKDAMGWYYHRETYRQWDALDLQNLMSIGMGELVRWNLENEPFLSATENVTAMCLFLFTFFVGNGAHAACSPLPGIMPRLRLHFRDTKIRAWLQQAGIETWVGLLLCIASSQNPSSEQYFFRFLIEVLAVRQPPVTTYDEFRQTLLGGIWSPIMEGHAIKAWKEIEEPLKTATEALESRGSEAFSNVMRPRPKDAHLKPTIPMSNPYATSHMKKIFSSAKEEITVEVFKT
ncbi:hypothetical protein QBC35DRAFT_391270 [Podospora australis]|uniref:Uncharacterized protein n=1 Tax=Podospora australis TaxID=1536484 RepID=A0AAN6WQR2_9PEZI|nr:hypothetical protein QBC35DRAFT_391270 [Podospora australis]